MKRRYASDEWGFGAGISKLNQDFAGFQHVRPGESTKSSTATSRTVLPPAIRALAPSAISAGVESAAGDAIAQITAHRGAVLDLQRSDEVRGLGQAGVIFAHHLALVDLDAGDRSAETQSLSGIELNLPQLLDVLQINDELGASHRRSGAKFFTVPGRHAGAQLDEEVGASHERTRLLAMAFHHRHRLSDGSRDFIANFVQRRKSSQSNSF